MKSRKHESSVGCLVFSNCSEIWQVSQQHGCWASCQISNLWPDFQHPISRTSYTIQYDVLHNIRKHIFVSSCKFFLVTLEMSCPEEDWYCISLTLAIAYVRVEPSICSQDTEHSSTSLQGFALTSQVLAMSGIRAIWESMRVMHESPCNVSSNYSG